MDDMLVMEGMVDKTNQSVNIINPEKNWKSPTRAVNPKTRGYHYLDEYKVFYKTQDEFFIGAKPMINEVVNAFGLKNKSDVQPNGDRYKDDFIFFKTNKF